MDIPGNFQKYALSIQVLNSKRVVQVLVAVASYFLMYAPFLVYQVQDIGHWNVQVILNVRLLEVASRHGGWAHVNPK